MKRILTFLAALVLCSVRPSLAEVAVVTSASGALQELRVNTLVIDGLKLHWTPEDPFSPDQFLNIDGDINGDLAPAWVLAATAPPQILPLPVIVWSRQNDGSFDVFASFWETTFGWTTPEALSTDSTDELGVRLLIAPDGDVFAVWWSSAKPDTTPAVWFSRATGVVWAPAERVTPNGVDARSPELELDEYGDLYVHYQDWSERPVRTGSSLLEHFDP